MIGNPLLLIENQLFSHINEFEIPTDCSFKTVYDRKEKKKFAYALLPITFDIETTNTYSKNGMKISFMYIWQACIFGHYVYGRTWDEWYKLIDDLNIIYSKYNTDKTTVRFICYIHNLSFEFAYMHSRRIVNKVFARKNRKIMYFTTNDNMIYKCSYFLSGYSLQKVGENLKKPVCKDTSKLDYSKIRTSDTELTYTELEYCFYDVYILYLYILEMLERYEYIYNIPLTKTSCVRQDCYNKLIKDEKSYKSVRRLIMDMIPSADEYKMLIDVYWGAYVHGMADIMRKTLYNVDSYDFTSSYPYQLCTGYYPVSKFTLETNKSRYDYDLQNFACMVKCKMSNVMSKKRNHILSIHKCSYLENECVDNGRLVSASEVHVKMTSIDLRLMYMFYDFDLEILELWWAYQDFLPKPIIMLVLDYYVGKTELKDIDGYESEYMWQKEVINSIYGCCVTKPCNSEILFIDGEWITIPWDKKILTDDNGNIKRNERMDPIFIDKTNEEIEKALYKYYKNNKQFLQYSWGCWCTANSRYALLSVSCDIDIYTYYSDTDSIKADRNEKVKRAIEQYNSYVYDDIKEVCDYYDIDIEKFSPKNKDGERFTLGLFCHEHTYLRFKTLGAKKYLSEFIKKGEKQIKMTVSGCGKKALEYMENTYKDVFDAFDDELTIPCEYSGRMTAEYFETPFIENITDFQGNKTLCSETSYVHMENTEYTFSMTNDFIKYILSVVQGYNEVGW